MNRYYFMSFIEVPTGSEWMLTDRVGDALNNVTWRTAPYPEHILIGCRELGGTAFDCGIIGDGRSAIIRRDDILNYYKKIPNTI